MEKITENVDSPEEYSCLLDEESGVENPEDKQTGSLSAHGQDPSKILAIPAERMAKIRTSDDSNEVVLNQNEPSNVYISDYKYTKPNTSK
jgi:hypothetical protein